MVSNHNTIGIIPIENSYAGSVHENLYHINQYPVRIIGEFFLPVQHCLLATHNDKKILHKVYSHPQALMQCASYLHKHSITPQAYHDTAGSAAYIQNLHQTDSGCIASEFAAHIY
ncbi:MAG: hypothetical protein H6766_00450 [Candidatus Peribacteria bacterium]|nr:MAG: hypothetical protein H6766_00450 [Candidatus Peribacteria bacterium]